jgi:periplasmic protein TonB
MPAELFRSDLPATPIRRRVSLLPVSIAGHVVAIAGFVIAPIFATAELPEPPRRLLYETVDVILPPPPPVNRAPAGPAPTSDFRKAPIDAPPVLLPEPAMVTLGSDTGPVVDGGFEPGMPGIDGGLPTRVVEPLPPPPAVPTGPVTVGGQIKPPRRLVNVAPVYPSIAQQARVEGEVEIEAVIGEDGRVREARVVRGTPLLNDAALGAVRQWTFTPTTLNGEPVAVIMTVTVVFTLR